MGLIVQVLGYFPSHCILEKTCGCLYQFHVIWFWDNLAALIVLVIALHFMASLCISHCIITVPGHWILGHVCDFESNHFFASQDEIIKLQT